jgi:hypothetical protein
MLPWLQVVGCGGCVTSCAVPTPNNNIYPSLQKLKLKAGENVFDPHKCPSGIKEGAKQV